MLINADFELSFSPSAELIGPVRRFITDFYQRVLENEDLTSRMAVAAHELLENAVKYSCDEHSKISIAVTLNENGARDVIIRTWNKTTEANIKHIRRIMDDMVGASDAMDYYRRLMLDAVQNEDANSSGLGLGRIVAEGEMKLKCDVKEDWVCIEARAPL
jgi:hypothetical protein